MEYRFKTWTYFCIGTPGTTLGEAKAEHAQAARAAFKRVLEVVRARFPSVKVDSAIDAQWHDPSATSECTFGLRFLEAISPLQMRVEIPQLIRAAILEVVPKADVTPGLGGTNMVVSPGPAQGAAGEVELQLTRAAFMTWDKKRIDADVDDDGPGSRMLMAPLFAIARELGFDQAAELLAYSYAPGEADPVAEIEKLAGVKATAATAAA